MEINYTAIIGLVAGVCTTASFLPQVVKTMRTREAKDLSMTMYLVLAAGIFLWIIYGILIESLPVISANAVSFVLATIILILKIRYG